MNHAAAEVVEEAGGLGGGGARAQAAAVVVAEVDLLSGAGGLAGEVPGGVVEELLGGGVGVGDDAEAVEVVGGVAGGVTVGLVVEPGDSALGVGGPVGEVALVEDRRGGVQLRVADEGAIAVVVVAEGRGLAELVREGLELVEDRAGTKSSEPLKVGRRARLAPQEGSGNEPYRCSSLPPLRLSRSHSLQEIGSALLGAAGFEVFHHRFYGQLRYRHLYFEQLSE